jgi:4-oxalocrotonate tautomerase
MGNAVSNTVELRGASQLLLDVLKKPLASTFVVIDEVDMENWGVGGLPVEEYRQQAAPTLTLEYLHHESRCK